MKRARAKSSFIHKSAERVCDAQFLCLVNEIDLSHSPYWEGPAGQWLNSLMLFHCLVLVVVVFLGLILVFIAY